MPESPEVLIITEQLANLCIGKKLTSVSELGGRYSKSKPPGYDDLIGQLPLRIVNIQCHGKFIYWELENENYLWCTLGMTGQWSRTKTKHYAVGLNIDNQSIYLNDPRHFGTIRFIKGAQEMIWKLNSLGPDMFTEPDYNKFHQIIGRGKNKAIVQLLMDQKQLSGIGNYIKCESLYRARISPWRKCNTLSLQETRRLRGSVIDVMNESYRAGGATLATYRDFDGKAGGFSKHLKVYDKVVDPLGNKVIAETTPDKRTTYWVPGFQI